MDAKLWIGDNHPREIPILWSTRIDNKVTSIINCSLRQVIERLIRVTSLLCPFSAQWSHSIYHFHIPNKKHLAVDSSSTNPLQKKSLSKKESHKWHGLKSGQRKLINPTLKQKNQWPSLDPSFFPSLIPPTRKTKRVRKENHGSFFPETSHGLQLKAYQVGFQGSPHEYEQDESIPDVQHRQGSYLVFISYWSVFEVVFVYGSCNSNHMWLHYPMSSYSNWWVRACLGTLVFCILFAQWFHFMWKMNTNLQWQS